MLFIVTLVIKMAVNGLQGLLYFGSLTQIFFATLESDLFQVRGLNQQVRLHFCATSCAMWRRL